MREIKFRAWDRLNGKWVEDFGIYSNGEICTFTGSDTDILNIDVMQFTGLKDKNGKEIYEGDIIRFADDDENTFAVSWDYLDGWVIDGWIRLGNYFKKDCSRYYIPTVIGNIYENPELLI